eukprot:g7779.t1
MKSSFFMRLSPHCVSIRRAVSSRFGTIRCASSSNIRAKVKFTIPHHVEFGQSICVSGSEEELGSWQLQQSYPLEWTQGDVWTGVIELPSKEIEYKYVTVNEDGTPAEWQSCENFVANIENVGVIEIMDEWDGTLHKTNFASVGDVSSKTKMIQEEKDADVKGVEKVKGIKRALKKSGDSLY